MHLLDTVGWNWRMCSFLFKRGDVKTDKFWLFDIRRRACLYEFLRKQWITRVITDLLPGSFTTWSCLHVYKRVVLSSRYGFVLILKVSWNPQDALNFQMRQCCSILTLPSIFCVFPYSDWYAHLNMCIYGPY